MILISYFSFLMNRLLRQIIDVKKLFFILFSLLIKKFFLYLRFTRKNVLMQLEMHAKKRIEITIFFVKN